MKRINQFAHFLRPCALKSLGTPLETKDALFVGGALMVKSVDLKEVEQGNQIRQLCRMALH